MTNPDRSMRNLSPVEEESDGHDGALLLDPNNRDLC